jgi:hypothetical protein
VIEVLLLLLMKVLVVLLLILLALHSMLDKYAVQQASCLRT